MTSTYLILFRDVTQSKIGLKYMLEAVCSCAFFSPMPTFVKISDCVFNVPKAL